MKIVDISRVELVRKNFILNVFDETIAFRMIYHMENGIEKEYRFSINREGRVALCDECSSNDLDFNLEINKVLSVVKTFEEVYGRIVFDKLTEIEEKYNKMIAEENKKYEILDTGYLKEDIRVLNLQKSRFNRTRKKKELTRVIREKEILLNDMNAMNEYRMKQRNKIRTRYIKIMFEEIYTFLDDINNKLFS